MKKYFNFSQLQEVIQSSYKSSVACHWNIPKYDWNSFFQPHLASISGHSKAQALIFQTDSTNNVCMWYSTSTDPQEDCIGVNGTSQGIILCQSPPLSYPSFVIAPPHEPELKQDLTLYQRFMTVEDFQKLQILFQEPDNFGHPPLDYHSIMDALPCWPEESPSSFQQRTTSKIYQIKTSSFEQDRSIQIFAFLDENQPNSFSLGILTHFDPKKGVYALQILAQKEDNRWEKTNQIQEVKAEIIVSSTVKLTTKMTIRNEPKLRAEVIYKLSHY